MLHEAHAELHQSFIVQTYSQPTQHQGLAQPKCRILHSDLLTLVVLPRTAYIAASIYLSGQISLHTGLEEGHPELPALGQLTALLKKRDLINEGITLANPISKHTQLVFN